MVRSSPAHLTVVGLFCFSTVHLALGLNYTQRLWFQSSIDRSFCEDRRELNPITFAITHSRFRSILTLISLNLTIILYQIIPQKSNNLVAQAPGLEPRRTVLETVMLPLHHTHMWRRKKLNALSLRAPQSPPGA